MQTRWELTLTWIQTLSETGARGDDGRPSTGPTTSDRSLQIDCVRILIVGLDAFDNG